MKPCPFCGHEVDLEDGNTSYPNGIGWREEAMQKWNQRS